VTERAPQKRIRALEQAGAHIEICGTHEIDFKLALRRLRTRWKVKTLLCEGGGIVNDGLFRAGLVDELHLTICPLIFAGRRAPTIVDGLGHQQLGQAPLLRLVSRRRIGEELYLVYRKA
jgi:riboflavin biosynthesis pyrimidine reductase